MSFTESVSEAAAPNLISLLYGLPRHADDVVIASDSGQLAMGELVDRVEELADVLRAAGVRPGLLVGNLVASGPSAVVATFATWAVGAVYVPINRRYTADEVRAFSQETPFALLMGERADLTEHELGTGAVEYDYQGRTATVVAPADPNVPAFDPGIALVLRTSGTTGRPKAVLLRQASTIVSLDASLEKLRRRKPSESPQGQAPGSRGRPAGEGQSPRVNIIPVSPVYPDEVEEVLRTHPQVRDAGVAGVPDRRLGEVPYAWVIGGSRLDPSDLGTWCRDRLVPYKVPVGFTVVDDLPRSEIGKLLRRELVARHAGWAEPVGTAEA